MLFELVFYLGLVLNLPYVSDVIVLLMAQKIAAWVESTVDKVLMSLASAVEATFTSVNG